jgi:hypothetical protein
MTLVQTSTRAVCIFGTLHDYQFKAVRQGYLQNVADLVAIHQADLIAEEATGLPTTYARQFVERCRNKNLDLEWENIDLTREERKLVPDENLSGIGTVQDLDFQIAREWTWVVRTSRAMKTSALLICGWVHALSVAEKFRWAGFTVEVNVYFDKSDADRIAGS